MLKQEILFRGTEEQCREFAKENGLQFGDDDRLYLRKFGKYWSVEKEWQKPDE